VVRTGKLCRRDVENVTKSLLPRSTTHDEFAPLGKRAARGQHLAAVKASPDKASASSGVPRLSKSIGDAPMLACGPSASAANGPPFSGFPPQARYAPYATRQSARRYRS